jgi:hypothetical protein
VAGLEFEDHIVTDAEHEFYKSFVVILEHLKNRALKAEAEVRQLRKELDFRREQVEAYDPPNHVGH